MNLECCIVLITVLELKLEVEDLRFDFFRVNVP